jgi:hypothetical protein
MSDSQSVVVTGQSPTGNLQEAVEDAVRQLGHGDQWRLVAIEGFTGGTVGNHLNVHLTTDPGGTDRSGAVEVPSTRRGLVERLSGPDICNDGAEFELVSHTSRDEERLRLRPTIDEAREVLERAAGSRQEVRVSGYMRHVECTRMDVYHASPAFGGE